MTTRTRTQRPKYIIPPQLCWEDVKVGDDVPPVEFNLTIQRMVQTAGGNRDFTPLHHNTTIGKATGAPDMFRNNVSTLTLWERAISDWIGIHGRIKKVSFRIIHFHAAGDLIRTTGKVAKKWHEKGLNLVELEMENTTPRMAGKAGTVVVALPSRSNPDKTPKWNTEGVAI